MKEPDERLGVLESRMDKVEEGVANFRTFQVDARDFFSRADERAKNEKAFHELRDKEIKTALEKANQVITEKLGRRSLAWVVAGVLVAIASLCIAAAGLAVTWYVMQHAQVEPMKIFGAQSNTPTLSLNHVQDAAIPLHYGRRTPCWRIEHRRGELRGVSGNLA